MQEKDFDFRYKLKENKYQEQMAFNHHLDFAEYGIMENEKGYDFVNEINGDTDFWRIKVKIIRLWKQTFHNNPNEFASIEMILMDEKGKKIQAKVNNNLIPMFENMPEEGAVRFISNFGVVDNKERYRLVNHPYKLTFYKETSVQNCTDFLGSGYDFSTFQDIVL